jgi:hypothetical protein
MLCCIVTNTKNHYLKKQNKSVVNSENRSTNFNFNENTANNFNKENDIVSSFVNSKETFKFHFNENTASFIMNITNYPQHKKYLIEKHGEKILLPISTLLEQVKLNKSRIICDYCKHKGHISNACKLKEV